MGEKTGGSFPGLRRIVGLHRIRFACLSSVLLHLGLVLLLLSLVLPATSPRRSALILKTVADHENLQLLELEVTPITPEVQTQEFVETPSVDVTLPEPTTAGSWGAVSRPRSPSAHRLLSSATAIFQVGTGAAARGMGAGGGGRARFEEFEKLVQDLQRNGLDLVIVFDSTSSMSAEIQMVKARIWQIGQALMNRIPDTRIGFWSYKDEVDVPAIAGIPLTDDLQALFQFLTLVEPGGGGPDIEEAVDLGLEKAVLTTEFRDKARKVILIFGDAPPKAHRLPACAALARHFSSKQDGRISTITCRASAPLPEMAAIARHGGGEALVLINHQRILEELLVLVFGRRHRANVYEFFGLGPSP